MDYILGIDTGTSNVKAVLFDTNGTEVCAAARESSCSNTVAIGVLHRYHSLTYYYNALSGENKARNCKFFMIVCHSSGAQ